MHRAVPLGGYPDGQDAWLVVASAGGGCQHPAWFLNVAKNSDQVRVEVGQRRDRVRATSLPEADCEAALVRIAKIAPRYAGSQKKTDLEIPKVRLRPA